MLAEARRRVLEAGHAAEPGDVVQLLLEPGQRGRRAGPRKAAAGRGSRPARRARSRPAGAARLRGSPRARCRRSCAPSPAAAGPPAGTTRGRSRSRRRRPAMPERSASTSSPACSADGGSGTASMRPSAPTRRSGLSPKATITGACGCGGGWRSGHGQYWRNVLPPERAHGHNRGRRRNSEQSRRQFCWQYVERRNGSRTPACGHRRYRTDRDAATAAPRRAGARRPARRRSRRARVGAARRASRRAAIARGAPACRRHRRVGRRPRLGGRRDPAPGRARGVGASGGRPSRRSPAAAEPAEPEAPPELPSVERWRAKAQEPDWVEDDDGLGWEGEHEEPAPLPMRRRGSSRTTATPVTATAMPPPASPTAPHPSPPTGARVFPRRPMSTGTPRRHSRPPWPTATATPHRRSSPAFHRRRAGDRRFSGDTPAPAHGLDRPSDHSVAPDPDADVPERDWTRRDEAAALGAADVALSDDDWDDQQPTGREWGAAPATATPAPTAKRRAAYPPGAALGLYAVVGIGLVVLAATALLGGSGDPAPTAKTTPKPASTPAPPAAWSTTPRMKKRPRPWRPPLARRAVPIAASAQRRFAPAPPPSPTLAPPPAARPGRRRALASGPGIARHRSAGPPARILARAGGDPRSDADRLLGSRRDVHGARRVAEVVAVAAAGPRL